jgi:hypothetical protein
MAQDHSQRRENDSLEPEAIYKRMQLELLNSARNRMGRRIQPDMLWEAAFADGFHQQLTTNSDLAFEFLVVTDRGPTHHYKNYLHRVSDYDDLLAIVALSAVINDALH